MSDQTHVDFYFRYRVKDGQEDTYQSYLDKVFPPTQEKEPYVLAYEIFRSADGVYFHHERYTDESFVKTHVELTADAQAHFRASVDLLDVHAVGEFSEEFMKNSKSTVYNPVRSISR
ncbi:putative quinol monooxygenase [Streptomyces sp. CA-100214]